MATFLLILSMSASVTTMSFSSTQKSFHHHDDDELYRIMLNCLFLNPLSAAGHFPHPYFGHTESIHSNGLYSSAFPMNKMSACDSY
jgi:hypothetical protein